MLAQHIFNAVLLAGTAPISAAADGIEFGPEWPLGPATTRAVVDTDPDSFTTNAPLSSGSFEVFFAELARGGFKKPRDLKKVAAAAAIFRSNIFGPSFGQREVHHA